MLNVVVLQGRLARDPELRQTQTGKAVCNFTIACGRGSDQTDWLDVVSWDKTAEFICKYFRKGSMILLEGRLQSRKYQDKNGNNRTAIEVVAGSVNFCGGKQENGAAVTTKADKSETVHDGFAPIPDDGDLPF